MIQLILLFVQMQFCDSVYHQVYDSQLNGDVLYEGEVVIPEWEDSHCLLQVGMI